MIRYGSVCSGVEAASLAWEPLGWKPAFFSEVEPFPCAVLHHRFCASRPVYPLDPDEAHDDADRRMCLNWKKRNEQLPEQGEIVNYGDFTKIQGERLRGTVDLLVGGTPCQDLSTFGKRAGFAGLRSCLATSFVRLAFELGVRWIVWENVPGALSTNGGRDFATFLSMLCGYEIGVPGDGWKNSGIISNTRPDRFGGGWRVLDAQFTRTPGFPRGIPQRRKRVLFVGHFGDWTRAAKVLFHRERFEGSSPKNQNRSEPSLFASPEKSHRDKMCYGFMSHTGVGYHGITPYREISPTLLAEHNADLFILNGETATFRHQTPLETERLMGFPDNWTRIPWNGKPEEECPDGPRYKACGNSMCVNCMEWIGRRIQAVEDGGFV